jgi:hypothetical protein
MSYFHSTLNNDSPNIHFDNPNSNDINNLSNYYNTEDNGEINKNNETKQKIKDEIITYNFYRFMNGQLALSILASILFNYEILKDT